MTNPEKDNPITKRRQETFKYMLEKDCSKFTKVSPANKASYLSWAYAWQEFKKVYPFAYVVSTKNDHGTFELKDDFGTYFVEVKVCNGGEKSQGEYIEESQTVQLPIMDNKHKAMRSVSYEYTTKFGTKTVAGATSFDTNYALQRAKTKAISDFGLGLYIYHGESIPVENDDFVGAVEEANKLKPEDVKRNIWNWLLAKKVNNKTANYIYKQLNGADYIVGNKDTEGWIDKASVMFQELNEDLTAKLIKAEIDVIPQEAFADSIAEFNHLINLKNKMEK